MAVFSFILVYSYDVLTELEKNVDKQNLKEYIQILKTNVLVAGGITVLTILMIILKFIKFIKENLQEFEEDTGFLKSEFLKEKKINLKNLECIIAIDIDNLLKIDNTYGETVVKNIFAELFNILNSFFNEKAKLIRYSWDEILILIPKGCENKTLTMVKELKETIEKHKFRYKSLELDLKIHIGLNKELNKMKNLDEAIKYTFVALNQAKKSKRGIAEFGANKTANVLPKLIEIKEAIEKDKINLMFQPIVDIENKTIFKYEVLTRILGSDGREINPSEFLDVIKGTTLSTDFNTKVLEKAVETLKKYKDIELSVNFSPIDIIGGAVARKIREINDKKLLSRLTLEILETEDIYDYEKFKENIALIKLAGCKIAIDDFGKGYSNFMHLIELNVDFLKIDGDIVKSVKEDNKALILVSAIKDFADRAGIEVICEFVSNEETYRILKKLGIKYMQGYIFGKPVNIPQEKIKSVIEEEFSLKSKKEPKEDLEAFIWNENNY
jgi:diguanylate cyclase (GGDEF)-like protein